MPPARLVEVNAHRSSSEERRHELRQCQNRMPFGVPATRWRRTVASAAASPHQVEPAGAEDPQLGEPHDRFQGATNLRRARWSKPSQPGGTARAERVRKVAAPGRRWLRVARQISSEVSSAAALRSSGTAGSGHQAQMPMEGQIYDNPMRGAQIPDEGRTLAARPADPDGQDQRAAHTG
jgi:hypothetical protein